jgi:hypothetical protein
MAAMSGDKFFLFTTIMLGTQNLWRAHLSFPLDKAPECFGVGDNLNFIEYKKYICQPNKPGMWHVFWV